MKKISFPTDVKEPTRTGPYREPKKTLRIKTEEQKAERTRARVDKETAMRALNSVSFFKFGPIMEDGYALSSGGRIESSGISTIAPCGEG